MSLCLCVSVPVFVSVFVPVSVSVSVSGFVSVFVPVSVSVFVSVSVSVCSVCVRHLHDALTHHQPLAQLALLGGSLARNPRRLASVATGCPEVYLRTYRNPELLYHVLMYLDQQPEREEEHFQLVAN